MTSKEKNKLAGIFLLIHGGLLALIYLLMLVFFSVIIGADPNAPKAVLGIVGVVMFIFGAIFALPQIVGGWKMLKEKPDARNWAIAGSVIACLNAPLGTAAGVFSMIFLFSDEGNRFYNEISNPNYLNPANEVNDFNYKNFQQQQQKEPYNWK